METILPERLKERGVRFVLLERGGKRPFQNEWQNKTIEFDSLELQEHISLGGNYGVMGGGIKNLIVIDFDNSDLQNKIVPKLPKTLTVKTGTGKLHKYFYTDKAESFKIFDEEMNTLADVQGEGKQVVGCGSIHPNGNKYILLEDNEISFIPLAEIKALLLPYDRKPKKQQSMQEKEKTEKMRVDVQDDFLNTIKNYLSMEEVMSSFGIDTSRNPCACPFHSSKGGKCLGFNRETAHCFHCDGSWNIFSFVKAMKNCDFSTALEYLANLAGLSDELEVSKRKYKESVRNVEQDKKRQIRTKFLELTAGKEKKWASATELLVDYIKEKNYLYTTKDDVKSEVWIYKDGIYVSQGKSEIKSMLRELLGEWYSQFIYGLVIAKIEPDTYIETQNFFSHNYVREIALENGILDIFTRELKLFTPEKIFFNKMPIEYHPEAKCPQIDKFLNDVLPNEEDKDVFYEIGGFCLLSDYTFEKAFMFVGNGRNGKDKSLELIKRTLGVQNCSSIVLSSLQSEGFAISELFGKMANLAGEISNQDLKDTSMFKALTGRSLVSAGRKFLNNITFVNHAKFIFACNELPMVYDLSTGFWDRWVLLEFPFTFVSREEYNLAEKKDNLKLRDEDIISKITTKDELSGLLNKFLDGLTRLALNRSFSVTQSTEQVKNLWIRKSNSFVAFCMDNLEEDYEGKIGKKELRKRYAQYCKKHKVSSKSDIVLKRVLQDTFGANESDSYQFGSTYERCWEGIKWKK